MTTTKRNILALVAVVSVLASLVAIGGCRRVPPGSTAIPKPTYQILSKAGYEDISKVEVIDPKTVKFTFKKPYAPYRELFSASYMVLPKHALEGKDFGKVMNDSIPVASGPFMFKEWAKGDHITIVRNPKYWGTPAWLDQVVWKWVPEANTEVAQLKTGEVEAVNPSPDPALISQLKTAGTVQADPGTTWEHLAFNMTKPDVSDLKVRQAIAYTIDRQKIAEQVMQGQVKPLQDIFVPEQKAEYSAPWAIYKPDPAKVEGLMKSAGYVKGSDGFWAKGGTKLTLELKTTSGNSGRQKVFQILQAQLKAAGIDAKLVFEEANTFFGTTTNNGNFQVGQWAWVASPDPSVKTLFSANQFPPDGQNYYRYKNADVTKWIDEADASLDANKRAELSKQISAQMAKDLPLIPLYQRLVILATKNYVHGAKNNATLEGPFWNLGDWWKSSGTKSATKPVNGGTLTIGYEQEPQILNSFVTGGDMMATKDVQSNVLLGLIRLKPDFTYEPALAEEIPDISNGGVTENPFTVTWKIKKNAVWSDGQPVTADDVKFTWDTIMKGGSGQ